ncbi:MAG: transcription antitermination factor NusB [Candidatus Dadabacteria bacterium]|nr:transcription antitermination factor NusB [Candidatus Dadabacteria bacterium]
MGVRRRAREHSLQFLYQIDLLQSSSKHNDIIKQVELYWDNKDKLPEKQVIDFSNRINIGTAENLQSLDEIISKYSKNWKLNRLSKIDRNILRIAVYELLFMKDVPGKVVINEAIEIAKKYGTEESGSFINGILDKINKDINEGVYNDDHN